MLVDNDVPDDYVKKGRRLKVFKTKEGLLEYIKGKGNDVYLEIWRKGALHHYQAFIPTRYSDDSDLIKRGWIFVCRTKNGEEFNGPYPWERDEHY